MKDAKNREHGTVFFVNNYIIVPDHQFPCAMNSSWPAHVRIVFQPGNLFLNIILERHGGGRIVCGNVDSQGNQIGLGDIAPLQVRQGEPFPSLPDVFQSRHGP